jgi:hypothetical protein
MAEMSLGRRLRFFFPRVFNVSKVGDSRGSSQQQAEAILLRPWDGRSGVQGSRYLTARMDPWSATPRGIRQIEQAVGLGSGSFLLHLGVDSQEAGVFCLLGLCGNENGRGRVGPDKVKAIVTQTHGAPAGG